MNNARPTIATVLTLLKKFQEMEIIQTDTSCPKCTVQRKCKHMLNCWVVDAQKIFVKAAGQKTQRRLSEFASKLPHSTIT